jgi:hypothetical protein
MVLTGEIMRTQTRQLLLVIGHTAQRLALGEDAFNPSHVGTAGVLPS